MSDTDYYSLLGVNKKASDGEIKKAYRKLAMKYHPDHTEGDKHAEEQFKKISEAYAVLSDSKKRKQYDTFGSAGFQQRYSQEDIFRGFDFGDVFKEFGLSGSNRGGGPGGGNRFSFNMGDLFGQQGGQQAQRKGSDLVYELPLTLQEVNAGASKVVAFQHGGRSEKITVKVPKGMITGKRLRIAGKGEPSAYGGPPGDLFIKARLIADPLYEVNGNDLTITREIKLSEAILGTTLGIPILGDKELNLKIPLGVKHNTKMRLSGYGLPHMNGSGKGDLYARIHIAMPEELTEKQMNLIEQLEETGL
jgi:curved DNA-binding protein